MDFQPSDTKCNQKLGLPDCFRCGSRGKSKGYRKVAQMTIDLDRNVIRIFLRRRRVKCTNKSCAISYTIYESGGYPHRTYTLRIAVSMTAELACNRETNLTAVAKKYQCHRRTVARIVGWVGNIGKPSALNKRCSEIDPSGFPPPVYTLPPEVAPSKDPGPTPVSVPSPWRISHLARLTLAGQLLLLLEHLAKLLRNGGVTLESGPGLVAILRYQFERFRTVYWLTRAPPALRVA